MSVFGTSSNSRSSQLDERERNIAQREQEKQQRIERERQAQLVAQQQQSYSSQSYASSSNDSGEHGYYKNCAAVCRAGKAPLYAGQPGYSGKLDADGDGVACEWH